MTCWYDVKDDLIATGGIFIDSVTIDGKLISARNPNDLAEWIKKTIIYYLNKKKD